MSSTVHASALVVGDIGVLIRGASSAGKSSLLMNLLVLRPQDAVLIADDRVQLSTDSGRLLATVPEALAGLIEVRGQGILHRPFVSPAVINLVVDLLPLTSCPRMPEPDQAVATIEGVVLPRLILPVGSTDGPARLIIRISDLETAA